MPAVATCGVCGAAMGGMSCGACGATMCGGCGAWTGAGALGSHGCGVLAPPETPEEAAKAQWEPTIAETKADLKDLKAQGKGDTGRAADDRRQLRDHYVGLGIVGAIVVGFVLLLVLH